jgi:hypothetical protein
MSAHVRLLCDLLYLTIVEFSEDQVLLDVIVNRIRAHPKPPDCVKIHTCNFGFLTNA